jgi:hypothetical protein
MVLRLVGPTRVLLTAALVAAVPLCCCRGQMWASVFARSSGVEAIAEAGSPGGGMDCHGEAAESGSCGESCHAGTSAPCNHHAPCKCELQTVTKMLPDAPAPAVESQFASLLPAWAGEVAAWGGLVCDGPSGTEAMVRPSTSLLRLHCALIV